MSLNITYILFSIFYYCHKSVRTLKKENDGINGNKEISFGSSKKRDHLGVLFVLEFPTKDDANRHYQDVHANQDIEIGE